MKLKDKMQKALRVKIVTKPKPNPTSFEQEVDDLAADYLLHKDKAKSEESRAQDVNKAIKEFAEVSGKAEDKSKLCYGRKYVIGYSESAPAEKLDVERMSKALPPALFIRCIEQVPVPNEELVMELVQSKQISRKQFLNCLTTGNKEPVRRVYVAPISQHKAFKRKQKEASEIEAD